MKAPWRVAVLLAALAVAIVSRAWGAAPAVRTLENGLTVAVLRDSRLPIVQIQILVPAGTAQESDREHGAAPLVASLLTRGTTSRSADGFTAEVDDLGATISAEAGVEYATLGATFLSRDF
jgi:zinc protease